jgi:hypothetical protein
VRTQREVIVLLARKPRQIEHDDEVHLTLVHAAVLQQLLEFSMGQRIRLGTAIVGAANVSFGNDPERADGGERSAFVAVQLIPMIAVEDHLSVQGAGEVNMVEEHVARVSVATANITSAVASGFFSIARVVIAAVGSRSTTQRYPGHVNLARIAVAIARINLVEHGITSSPVTACHLRATTMKDGYQEFCDAATFDRTELERVGCRRFEVHVLPNKQPPRPQTNWPYQNLPNDQMNALDTTPVDETSYPRLGAGRLLGDRDL